MHIAVVFINIGSYHVARIEAAYKACQKLGWQLTTIQVTDDNLDHQWGDFSSKLSAPIKTLLPFTSKSYNPRRDSFSQVASQALKCYLYQLKPDVLFLPGWYFSVARSGLKWCQKNNALPILMSETKENDKRRFWWSEIYKTLILKNYKAALVGGKSHKCYLLKLGMKDDAIFYGYDVVNNELFYPFKKQCILPIIHKNYFLSISRFIPEKNILFLLKAYAAYHQFSGSNSWDLVICGDGWLHSKIEEYITELNLQNRVHLPGFLMPNDLLPYLAHASCFIHASIQEPWGLVVNEAMASGLPVLVSNRCGCFEDLIIEGVNGFGFDPNNLQQLTNLMLKMSSGEIDLEAVGQAALEHIQKFSPDHFAEGLVQAVKYALAHS